MIKIGKYEFEDHLLSDQLRNDGGVYVLTEVIWDERIGNSHMALSYGESDDILREVTKEKPSFASANHILVSYSNNLFNRKTILDFISKELSSNINGVLNVLNSVKKVKISHHGVNFTAFQKRTPCA